MKRTATLIASLLVASAAFAWPIEPTPVVAPDDLSVETEGPLELDNTWVVEKLHGAYVEVPDGNVKTARVDIDTDDMSFYGNDGCNIVSGDLCDLSDNSIAFTSEVGTRLDKCAPVCRPAGEKKTSGEACAALRTGDLVCQEDEPCANTCEAAAMHVDLADALDDVASYQIHGSKLYLYDSSGTEILRLKVREK